MKRVFYTFIKTVTVEITVNLLEKNTISPYQYKNIIITPSASLSEFILLNKVIIYDKPNSVEVKTFNKVIFNYFKLWKNTNGFINISQKDWMWISLKES